MAPKFKKPRAARGLTGGGQATLRSLGHANLVEKGHKVNRLLHKTMSNPTKNLSTQQCHLQPSLRVQRSRDLGPPLHSEPQLHPQVRAGSRASGTVVEGEENAGGHMGVIATRGLKRKAGADGPGGIPPLHAMAPGSKRKPLAAIDNLQSAAPGDAVPGGFLLQSASGRKVDVSAAAVAGVMKHFGEDGADATAAASPSALPLDAVRNAHDAEEWQQGQKGMQGPQGQQGQQGVEGQQGIQGQQEQKGVEGQQGIQGQQGVPVTNESTAVALTTALNPSPLSLPPEPPPQPPHTAAALITTAQDPSPLSLIPPQQQPPPRTPARAASLFQTARGKPVHLSSAAVDKACALLGVQQHDRPRFGDGSANPGRGEVEGSTVRASLFQTASKKPVRVSAAAVDKACALLGVQQCQRPRFDAPQITPPPLLNAQGHMGSEFNAPQIMPLTHVPPALLNAHGHEGQSSHAPAAMELSVRNSGAELAVLAQPDAGASLVGATAGGSLFQTARGKPVPLSSAAVDKACALLGVQQCEPARFDIPRIAPPKHCPLALLDAQGHEEPAGMELSVRNPGAELARVAQPDGGAGLRGAIPGGATVRAGLFQTARGKPVSVSSAAVDKACALLGVQQGPPALLDAQGHERQNLHVPTSMDLSVRNSGAELAVVVQRDGGAGLRRALPGDAIVGAGLFQTARGKPVSVSSAAVDKACALLGVQQGPPALLDAQGHEKQSSHAPAGMELSVRNPGAELAVVAHRDGGGRLGGASQGGATVRARLFQTGRGKPVSLSSAAVDKACALLGVQPCKRPSFDAPRISGDPAVPLLQGAGAEQASAIWPDGGASSGAATGVEDSFQTARGEPVHISSAAVDKACALLDVQQYEGPPQLEAPRRISGEPTVRLLESSSAGAAEQKRAAQRGAGASPGGVTAGMALLQTASEKPVLLSSAAVDQACALLGAQQHERPRFEGSASLGGATVRTAGLFQTASKKPVHISAASVDKACALFGVQQRERPQLEGSASLRGATVRTAGLFQTASKKPVVLSSAAVDKACAFLGLQQHEGPRFEAPRITPSGSTALPCPPQPCAAIEPSPHAPLALPAPDPAAAPPPPLALPAPDAADESTLRPPSPPSWPLALSQPSSQGVAVPAVEARAALARAEEMVASLFDLGTWGSGGGNGSYGEGSRSDGSGSGRDGGDSGRGGGGSGAGGGSGEGDGASPHTPALAQPPPLRSSNPIHPTSPLRPCPPLHPSSPLHRSRIPSHPSNSPLHHSHTPLHTSPNRLHNAPLHTSPTPLHRSGTTLRRPLTPLNRSPSTSPSPRRAFIPPTSTIPSLFSKHRPPRSRSAGLPPIPMRSLTDAADPPSLDVNQKAAEGRVTADNGAVLKSMSGSRTDGAGAAGSGAGGAEGAGAVVMVRQQEGGLRRLHDLYRDADGKPRRRPCMAEYFGYPPGLERVEGKVSEEVRKMTAESALTFVFTIPSAVQSQQQQAQPPLLTASSLPALIALPEDSLAAEPPPPVALPPATQPSLSPPSPPLPQPPPLLPSSPQPSPPAAGFRGGREGSEAADVGDIVQVAGATNVSGAADVSADAVGAAGLADVADRAILTAAGGDAACAADVASAADAAAGLADLADRASGAAAGNHMEHDVGSCSGDRQAHAAATEAGCVIRSDFIAAASASPAEGAEGAPTGERREGTRGVSAQGGDATAAVLTIVGAPDGGERAGVGAKDFQDMLIAAGAHPKFATIEWVTNHYRWVVWKLACQERSFPRRLAGRMLTVEKVLEQLKYRWALIKG
ncbi:unnamed protein product [Closterium sp. Yama58-4]|nr:unnamed protein product [Closterium sp. Yama58-4]